MDKNKNTKEEHKLSRRVCILGVILLIQGNKSHGLSLYGTKYYVKSLAHRIIDSILASEIN